MAESDGGLSRRVWDGAKHDDHQTRAGLATSPVWHPDALMRAALDACADPVAIKDTAHRFLVLNPAMAQLLGQDQEAALGKTWTDLSPCPQVVQITEDERTVLETGKGLTREHLILSPGGGLRVGMRIDPVWVAGVCAALMIVMRTIAEGVNRDQGAWHKAVPYSEEPPRAVAAREDGYRTLVEHQMAPVVKIDAAFRFTYVNPAYCRLFGRSPEALLGKSFLPLVHEHDRAATTEALSSLAESSHVCALEQRALTVYGWRWLAWQVTALLDDQGQVCELVGVGWDINAHREADRKRMDVLTDLKRAQTLARIGNWSLDPTGGLSTWSDEVYRLFERDPALGPASLADYDDMVEGADRVTVRNALEQAIQTGRPFEITLCLRRPDGRIKWIHALGEPDPVPGPAGYTVRGTFQDVTRQHDVEQALRQSEACHRLITESVSDIIGLHGSDGLLHYVSPAFQAVLGWPPEKILGSTPITLIAPEHRPMLRGALKEALMGVDVAALRYRIYHRDGYWVWLETQLSCVRDPDTKTVTEVVALSRDITLQVRREEDLRRNRQLYKGLFDSSSAVMLLIDPDSGEILKANGAAALFYGYSQVALQRMFIDDLNTLPADQLLEERRRARESECTLFQFQHRLCNGEIRDVEVNATPFDLDGRIVLFSIIHDVTDRMRAEEALHASEREKVLLLSRSLANLHALFDSSPDFLTVLDLSGHLLAVNRAVEERLGWCADDLIGQPVSVLHPQDMGEQAATCVRLLLNGESRSQTCTLPMVTRDGHHVPVETTIVHGTWNGQPAVFGTSRDMTELSLSRQMFETSFRDNVTAMIITDPETGRVIDANRASLAIMGWQASDVIGRTTVDLGLISSHQERKNLLETLLKTNQSDPFEMEVVTPSGIRVVGQAAARLISSGPQTFVLIMATDLTRQKALMKALQDGATDAPSTGMSGPQDTGPRDTGPQDTDLQNTGPAVVAPSLVAPGIGAPPGGQGPGSDDDD